LVIRSCLCTGITALRKANLGDLKGGYYTAFFQLATGIERLAKLALILDHMAQDNLKPPGERAVKAYGHDLAALFSKVEKTSQMHGYTLGGSFSLSPLSAQILHFLSEFAKGMRYANLDALAAGKIQKNPFGEWEKILQRTIASKVPGQRTKTIINQSRAIANAVRDMTLVMASDLAGKPLSPDTMFSEPRLLDEAAKYLVWELLCLLAPLRDFVVKAGRSAELTEAAQSERIAHIPNISEFFDFIWLDKPYVLRKKRWP